MRCWVGTSRTATVDKDDVSIFFFFINFLFYFLKRVRREVLMHLLFSLSFIGFLQDVPVKTVT